MTASAYQSSYGGGDRDAFVSQLSHDGQILNWSTYLGGQQRDRASGIVVDDLGAVTVAGWTFSSADFPITSGALQSTFGGGESDAFVSQLNATGNALQFSTYLGSDNIDKARSIALDSDNNIYVAGYTDSITNFPLLDAVQPGNNGGLDAFISALTPDGSVLIYSTYYGGGDNDRGHAIAADNRASAYITGFTRSTLDFPIENAVQPLFGGGASDAFVAKLGPDNQPPEIASSPVTTAELGVPYS